MNDLMAVMSRSRQGGQATPRSHHDGASHRQVGAVATEFART